LTDLRYTEEEVIEASRKYFNGDDLAAKVWANKYALAAIVEGKKMFAELTPDDMHRRMAREFARAEAVFQGPATEEDFYKAMENFKYIVPQGSVMFGSGNPHVDVSLSNCVVVDSPKDSWAGIQKTATELGNLFKRRAGVGIDISSLRPSGAKVNNAAMTTSGAWSFAEHFSNVTRLIGQNGRRGALMVTIDVRHPDVEAFAKMKRDTTKVTGANVSILLTDEFMEAVENDRDWVTRWPIESPVSEAKFVKTYKARELWHTINESAWLSAEPGLIFSDNYKKNLPAHYYPGFEFLTVNPCQPGWASVLTPAGIRTLDDVGIGDTIWSGQQWTKITDKAMTGVKPVFAYKTTAGTVYSTANHNVMCRGDRVPAGAAEAIDIAYLLDTPDVYIDTQDVIDGVVFGDGSHHKAWGKVYLNIGDGDRELLTSEVGRFIGEQIKGLNKYAWNVETTLQPEEMNNLPDRCVPDRFRFGSPSKVAGFLRGLFSANGSIVRNRVTLKITNPKAREVVQEMLSSLGIPSYFTTNKEHDVAFDNGVYRCKESYDINIGGREARLRFSNLVGFVHSDKQDRLVASCRPIKPKGKSRTKGTFEIAAVEFLGEMPVYDITVEAEEHTYWHNALLVSNCSEIGLSAYDSCRLISLNLKSFVKKPYHKGAKFDLKLFAEMVALATRMSDNLVELEIEALTKIINKCDDPADAELWSLLRQAGIDGRRVGLGAHGLADVFLGLGYRYDSDEASKVSESIFKTLRDTAYSTSVQLAKERGPFPAWGRGSQLDMLDCDFITRMPNDFQHSMQTHGRRNISLLTMAPTGTVSLVSQTSSGIEPVFEFSHTRKKKIEAHDTSARVDETDAMGDRWQHFKVYHHAAKEFIESQECSELGCTDDHDLPSFFVSSSQIDPMRRVEIQGVIQKYIDHGISSCLAVGETSIQTDRGLFDIEELVDRDAIDVGSFGALSVGPVSSVNCNGQVAQVAEGYNNGVRPVLTVELEGGHRVIGTSNHRVQVLTQEHMLEWKCVSDLQLDDLVCCRMGLRLFNDQANKITLEVLNGSVFDYRKNTNSKPVTLPRYMTTELARLLGYLCSDGSVGENGITLCQLGSNREVIDDFKQLVWGLFGIHCTEVRDHRADDVLNIVANSREVAAFMKWLGVTNHDDIRVPRVVRLGTLGDAKQFIRGMTLDGYVSSNRGCVATSVSRRYLAQAQTMLTNIGIDSTIYVASLEGERQFPNGNTYAVQRAYSLTMSVSQTARFADQIGYAEVRKQEAAEQLKVGHKEPVNGSVYGGALRNRFRAEVLPTIRSKRLYDTGHALTITDKQGRWITRESVLELVDLGLTGVPDILCDPTYVFRPVTSIEATGEVATLDLSVPDGHSYIANGVVCHNTINLPSSATIEQVEQLYMSAWKHGLKGVTVYRDGCRSGVLVTENTGSPDKIKDSRAPKRPKVLDCAIHRVKVKNRTTDEHEDWTFLVGLLDGKPYEIFGGPSDAIELPRKVTTGRIRKRRCEPGKAKSGRSSCYDLLMGEGDDLMILKDIANVFSPEDEDYGLITRIVSQELRHGVPIVHIVDQLGRSEKAALNSFSKVMARVLKKFIKDGAKSGENCLDCGAKYVFSEGCQSCPNCGSSKCS
jgi:ribonucleotide reductase alpha subunit